MRLHRPIYTSTWAMGIQHTYYQTPLSHHPPKLAFIMSMYISYLIYVLLHDQRLSVWRPNICVSLSSESLLNFQTPHFIPFRRLLQVIFALDTCGCRHDDLYSINYYVHTLHLFLCYMICNIWRFITVHGLLRLSLRHTKWQREWIDENVQ